jgi:hypothetical protein
MMDNFMGGELSLEQRFVLQRARYEVSKMSRYNLERTAVKLLKSKIEQKNGIQRILQANGIIMKISESQQGLPEIISEETFISLLEMEDDEIPTDIMDQGNEDDDLDDDVFVMD